MSAHSYFVFLSLSHNVPIGRVNDRKRANVQLIFDCYHFFQPSSRIVTDRLHLHKRPSMFYLINSHRHVRMSVVFKGTTMLPYCNQMHHAEVHKELFGGRSITVLDLQVRFWLCDDIAIGVRRIRRDRLVGDLSKTIPLTHSQTFDRLPKINIGTRIIRIDFLRGVYLTKPVIAQVTNKCIHIARDAAFSFNFKRGRRRVVLHMSPL